MHRNARRIALFLLASLAWLASSCATDDKPSGPEDSASSLPWNRPLPGEHSGPLGGMPFQSH